MKKVITKKIKDTLPETLYELLEVALDDLESISEKEEYKVDMGELHDVEYGSVKCSVGLSGSVMARLTGYNPKTSLHPIYFKDSLGRKLLAIESLLRLQLDRAFCYLYTVNEYRRFYKREKLIDQICERKVRNELENLAERMRFKEYVMHGDYEDFKEAMKVYRDLQKEIKSVGV